MVKEKEKERINGNGNQFKITFGGNQEQGNFGLGNIM